VRALSRYTDLIAARLNRHRDLQEMAAHSEVPVINGLTDRSHPCQGLADFMTISEFFGTAKGVHLTYVGDGNNVCHSLMSCALKAGASITVSSPPEYAPSAALSWQLQQQGLELRFQPDAKLAVKDADVVYTDAFISMGEEHLHETKLKDFAGYQVNEELMREAPAHALFMHCLPAHRGEEVSDGVLDSENSVVFDQAESRRHVQLALILFLLRENDRL
jgi:ornithine carbamoyltransferase